jgi:hypothetical protein
VANLSDEKITLTALLPDDTEADRNLLFMLLDQPETPPGASAAQPQTAYRELSLEPCEVAMFDLKATPKSNHVSLFRVRKEGAPGSSFLKYSVQVNGGHVMSLVQFVGARSTLTKVESPFPHLLYLW